VLFVNVAQQVCPICSTWPFKERFSVALYLLSNAQAMRSVGVYRSRVAYNAVLLALSDEGGWPCSCFSGARNASQPTSFVQACHATPRHDALHLLVVMFLPPLIPGTASTGVAEGAAKEVPAVLEEMRRDGHTPDGVRGGVVGAVPPDHATFTAPGHTGAMPCHATLCQHRTALFTTRPRL
jgi:hypothetical protein